jgi:hypothetical protein
MRKISVGILPAISFRNAKIKKDQARPQAQPGSAGQKLIRKKPFWNRKPALLNRLEFTHLKP